MIETSNQQNIASNFKEVTGTNVAAMQQLRNSAQKKCAHFRYLTKLFLRIGHFLFRLSTNVLYYGCFVNHLNLHNYTYHMHCPCEWGQILNKKMLSLIPTV
jgi:hypothetical protein